MVDHRRRFLNDGGSGSRSRGGPRLGEPRDGADRDQTDRRTNAQPLPTVPPEPLGGFSSSHASA